MTPDEKAESAKRILAEPFFRVFLKEAQEKTLAMLSRATTDDERLKVQARHQAHEELSSAVRKAAKV